MKTFFDFSATTSRVALDKQTFLDSFRDYFPKLSQTRELLWQKAANVLEIQGFVPLEVSREVIIAEMLQGEFKRGSSLSDAPSRFDCSSLVKYFYAEHGIRLPRRSVQIADLGREVPISDIQYGDILFFAGYHERKSFGSEISVGHVALALSKTEIVQATRKYGVRVHLLSEFCEERKLIGVRRIVDRSMSDILVFSHPPELEIERSSDVFWITHDVFKGWIKKTTKDA